MCKEVGLGREQEISHDYSGPWNELVIISHNHYHPLIKGLDPFQCVGLFLTYNKTFSLWEGLRWKQTQIKEIKDTRIVCRTNTVVMSSI